MMARVLAAIVTGWAVTFVELVLVAVLRREFASIWEIQYGSLWLAPTALLVAALPSAFGGVAASLLERDARWARWVLTVLAAAGAGTAAFFVSTGRHFASLPVRGVFVIGVGLVAGGLVSVLVRPLRALALGRPVAFGAVIAALVMGCEIVNASVLVRLYPAFHAGLAATTLLLAGMLQLGVVAPALSARARRGGALAMITALAAFALSAPSGARRLSALDNYRVVLVHHAPLLGQAVRVAARFSPAGGGPKQGPGVPEVREQGPSVALSGYDILLVTIDALRADHVGTYGYKRPTTPNLDVLAREGIVFDRAYCPSPHTSYSVTSLLTGKYMRPLLLQEAGYDSETLATLLRRYGYRTAAFYPPAVFFIDQARFAPFEQAGLGFEYRKAEFLEGEGRVRQVEDYLVRQSDAERLFLWVHLFGPHEPYEAQSGHSFGVRDVDRYDSEIAAADATVGRIVEAVRRRRERVLVIATSDHGEEFGDHGGRYHGTTVFEEQVRVPLIVHAPALLRPARVQSPVQTIDLMPTLLEGLEIPIPPRIRGRSLGAALTGAATDAKGFAFAETDEQTLLAEESRRLVCERKIGACALYDLAKDPEERVDIAREQQDIAASMRRRLDELTESHGTYEDRGLRAEGKGWPPAILRGLAGDGDAAVDIAELLDDADVEVRRKAAELLFEVRRAETAPALRLSLQRDEDPGVRRWSALALTRLGEGAPLVHELLRSGDPTWQRLAALALAEAGDGIGTELLIDWWMRDPPTLHQRSLDLLNAFAKLKTRKVVWPLVQRLDDVRLRPHLARTLAAIGDDSARGPLVRAFSRERYQSARTDLARALVGLGAREELARPLARFLGTPDPLADGLGIAMQAGILEHVGGPGRKHLERLRQDAHVGAMVRLIIPKGTGHPGLRLLVRGRATAVGGGEVRVGRPEVPLRYDSKGKPLRQGNLPVINPSHQISFTLPQSDASIEMAVEVPTKLALRPGLSVDLVVFADRAVELDALAVVPLADELPPPAPEPWTPDGADAGAPQPETAPTVL